MQKVISNSSPIIHLAKIGKLDFLKEYFQTIIIPEAVYRECIIEGKERDEVKLIKQATWIKVVKVKEQTLVKLLRVSLDVGESEVIALSIETGADLILLDDSEAREIARLYGFKITVTLGILLKAKKDGKINSLKTILIQLKETGFWIDDDLQYRLLHEAGE
jgi:hypothetical protein